MPGAPHSSMHTHIHVAHVVPHVVPFGSLLPIIYNSATVAMWQPSFRKTSNGNVLVSNGNKIKLECLPVEGSPPAC